MTTPLADLVEGLERLEVDETLDVLVGLQRAQSRLAWAEYQALLRVAGPYQRTEEVLVFDRRVGVERVVEVTDEVRDEVAAALHRSPTLVHDQITTARLLNGPLSATARALRDGQVTGAQVRVIVEQARRLPGAVRRARHPRRHHRGGGRPDASRRLRRHRRGTPRRGARRARAGPGPGHRTGRRPRPRNRIARWRR